jgi:hypothetical protein
MQLSEREKKYNPEKYDQLITLHINTDIENKMNEVLIQS